MFKKTILAVTLSSIMVTTVVFAQGNLSQTNFGGRTNLI